MTLRLLARPLENYIKSLVYQKRCKIMGIMVMVYRPALRQVYLLPNKGIKHLYYEVEKPNKQHDFNLLYS